MMCPQSAPFNRLYVFGDSYSDIGEGYLDGNGPTAVAYLAQRLGFTLHPSTAAATSGKSLDFAVSGAQTGASSGHKVESALLGYGMKNQVQDFVAKVRSSAIKFEPDKTLFFIAGGLNDRQLPSAESVANLKSEIKTLYAAGGRQFLLALLPTVVPACKVVGQRLNPELTQIPPELAAQLPQAHIALSHWGPFFDEVLRDPSHYGFKNTTQACAGRAIFHEDTTACSTPEAYFYYHADHPSTAAHKAVGEKLYREALDFGAQRN